MRNQTIAILVFAATAPIFAAVTNVTPKSEDNSPPKGTRFFSSVHEEAPATPLAELLSCGTGTIEFINPVTFTVEEVDKDKVADDGSSYVTVERSRKAFPFDAGRYRVVDKAVEQSATRIFTSSEGWLVIQRGHAVRLVPIANIKSISGWIPDQKAGDAAAKPQTDPAK